MDPGMKAGKTSGDRFDTDSGSAGPNGVEDQGSRKVLRGRNESPSILGVLQESPVGLTCCPRLSESPRHLLLGPKPRGWSNSDPRGKAQQMVLSTILFTGSGSGVSFAVQKCLEADLTR